MKKNKTNTIPSFATREEEAKFWETHSIADFPNDLKPAKARFAKNLSEGITIRFEQSTLNKLRKISHAKGIGPTTLARMWILEQLQQHA